MPESDASPVAFEPETPSIKLRPYHHIVYRVTPEAHAWACGLAAHCSLNLTNLHWLALIRMAEVTGFHVKVPSRYLRPVGQRRGALEVK